jgi:hypothetical protein
MKSTQNTIKKWRDYLLSAGWRIVGDPIRVILQSLKDPSGLFYFISSASESKLSPHIR